MVACAASLDLWTAATEREKREQHTERNGKPAVSADHSVLMVTLQRCNKLWLWCQEELRFVLVSPSTPSARERNGFGLACAAWGSTDSLFPAAVWSCSWRVRRVPWLLSIRMCVSESVETSGCAGRCLCCGEGNSWATSSAVTLFRFVSRRSFSADLTTLNTVLHWFCIRPRICPHHVCTHRRIHAQAQQRGQRGDQRHRHLRA